MGKFNSFVKANCMECSQMKDIPEDDLVWLRGHNLDLNVMCNRCSKAFDEITLEEAQWLKERRLCVAGICKDCGEAFIITPEEISWLLENDLKLFKRCQDCRQKNKEKKAQLDFQELMDTAKPLGIDVSEELAEETAE